MTTKRRLFHDKYLIKKFEKLDKLIGLDLERRETNWEMEIMENKPNKKKRKVEREHIQGE